MFAPTHAECDITIAKAVEKTIEDFRPDVIINAAAYTNVDGAESDREGAFAVNATGAGNLARGAREQGCRLIHISTDYVFDGSQRTPYSPTAPTAPLGVYGASKLAGEQEVVASGAVANIVRTAWIYAEHGRNFLRAILRQLEAGNDLRVVNDQVGTPTSAFDFAAFLWKCAANPPRQQILHWTNSGTGTWYDFAVSIQELAAARGLVGRGSKIFPVPASEYPTRAQRPSYSVLDCSLAWEIWGPARDWRIALAETLDRLARDAGSEQPLSR
jgi:dTDP-4-dehydrorhamnose reductase